MVSHRAIHKLLVVNAAAQGETIDDVMTAYRAASCRGAVLSKIDEAVKLGPALDALIRHKLPVLGVANGQRVPEDWHRLSSHALVQRALRERPATPWRLDAGDVSLVFAGAHRRAVQPDAASCLTRWLPLRSLDQADGLRRLFAASTQTRFVPLVSNPHVAFGSVIIERLVAAFAQLRAHTLVVDAAENAPAPREIAQIDLGEAIEPLSRDASYLAAHGLPRRHVDARGSSATLLQALADAAPQADVVLIHADRCRLVAPVRAPRSAPDRAGLRPPGRGDPRLCRRQVAGDARRAHDARPAARRRNRFPAR